MEVKKENRGGSRFGSGRKRIDTEVRATTISVCGTPTEIAKIKSLAKESKKTISRFLIEMALEEKISKFMDMPIATGDQLNKWAYIHGLERNENETDEELRIRILSVRKKMKK